MSSSRLPVDSSACWNSSLALAFDNAAVQMAVQRLANPEEHLFLPELQFEERALVQLPWLWLRHIQPLAILVVGLGLPEEVHDPVRDRLDFDLGAFALEELKHVEVAVAFGGLREELARHFHEWLGTQAVDLD